MDYSIFALFIFLATVLFIIVSINDNVMDSFSLSFIIFIRRLHINMMNQNRKNNNEDGKVISVQMLCRTLGLIMVQQWMYAVSVLIFLRIAIIINIIPLLSVGSRKNEKRH